MKSVTDSLTDSDPDLLRLEMLEQLKTSLVPSDSNVWCEGGAGTALSHWERRIFHNEAMTGSVLPGSVLSRLSLALLEDSGWYIPHYDLAQPLTWGAGAGCDFASKSCMELLEQQDSHYCSIQHRNLSCTSDLTAAGVCNLVEFGQDRRSTRTSRPGPGWAAWTHWRTSVPTWRPTRGVRTPSTPTSRATTSRHTGRSPSASHR